MFVLSNALKDINQEIETKYEIGDTLPGQKLFATDTLYSLQMVREAFYILDLIGVIRVKHGKPTIITNRIANVSEQDIEKCLNELLASNIHYNELNIQLNEAFDVGDKILNERDLAAILGVLREDVRLYLKFFDFLGYFEVEKQGKTRTLLKKLPTIN